MMGMWRLPTAYPNSMLGKWGEGYLMGLAVQTPAYLTFTGKGMRCPWIGKVQSAN